jgi:hypothetical protein
MSAWGGPAPAAHNAWAQQVEDEERNAPPPAEAFPVLGAKEAAFPTLAVAAKVKKPKKQTMSLADFNAAPSTPAGGGYRAPSSRGVPDDVLLQLPTGPRMRDPNEEEGKPGLGGAFRDYGGDRGETSKYGAPRRRTPHAAPRGAYRAAAP